MCGSFLFKKNYVCGRTKGSLAPCLVAARAVCWRPRLAGTRQYIGPYFPVSHVLLFIVHSIFSLFSNAAVLSLDLLSYFYVQF